MTWVVMLLATGLLGLLFWQWARRPYVHRKLSPSDIERLQGALLRRGFDRGVLILELAQKRRRSPRRFVQFTKYVGGDGKEGLQFDFPLAAWSTPYYEALRTRLIERGIAHQIEKTGRPDTKEFISVDVAGDVARAREVALLTIELLSEGQSPEVSGVLHGVRAD